VVVALAEEAARRLAGQRERLGQQVVEALAALEVTAAELGVRGGQVLDLLDLGPEGVDAAHHPVLEALHIELVVVEELLDETGHQSLSARTYPARPSDSLTLDRTGAVSRVAAGPSGLNRPGRGPL